MTDLLTSRFQSQQQIGILSALHDYWLEKRGDHPLPARGDLDPADFRYALGNVSLIDVLRDPLRFRIRVIASNIESRFDRALTGCFLEDFPEPESACLWDKVYRKVIATGEPHSFVGDVREDGADRRYRARVWPLGGNRRDIDMLLCCREPVEEGDGAEPDRVENWET